MTRQITSALLILLGNLVLAEESSRDGQFLAGLRQRGLFQLAETYCQGRLERTDLSQVQRAELVIELSRCLAERAVSSPREARGPLWQRAFQVTDDFARQFPDSPRLPLVGFQGALTHLTRGELAQQESQQNLDQARESLRLAVRGLDALAEEVDRRLREANLADRAADEQLTPVQLATLKKNIEYQQARALRNQAACYEADSPDRANSLSQAVELLTPLAKLDPADPVALKSRIDLVTCYRLLADYRTARSLLDGFLGQDNSPETVLRLRAQQIHLALAQRQLADALSIVSQGRQLEGRTSPELDYAHLEAYVRSAAEDEAESTRWQSQATAMVETIERDHRPYWTRRAGMLLSTYLRGISTGGNLDVLVRVAESSYRSGQLDEAIAAYDSAGATAAEQGDADRAFELGYIAATIEHRRNRHQSAMQRYHRIATARPDHAKAAEAHLLALHHAGQIAKQQPDETLDDYELLLEEHLRKWPDAPTAQRVLHQLGGLRRHRGNFAGAIEAYRAISPDDPKYANVVEAAAACWEASLKQRKAAGDSPEAMAGDADDAARWLESLIVGPQQQLPETWNETHRTAALAAGRLRLYHTPDGFARAENVLRAALQGADDAPAPWKASANALLVFALAGQGEHARAAEVLAALSSDSPGELIELLTGLQRMATEAKPEIRVELAQLQQRAVELLQSHASRLDPSQRSRLERLKAETETAAEEALARSLLASDNRRSLEKAQHKWRQLQKKFPAGSARWFEAKYSIALAHYRLGNPQQAAKIIRLVQLLHPDCGGPEMKARFSELLSRCGP